MEKLCTAIKQERDEAIRKYRNLASTLRDQVECPVCLEVPISGPVPVCPNGHFVCFTCKTDNCPTCRSRMLKNQSLLAVTVIENIEHKCRNDDCGELFPLTDLETHMKTCQYRIINCPAPSEFCGKGIAFCKVLDHVLNECEGSSNMKEGCNVLDYSQMPKVVNHTNSSCFPFTEGTKSSRGKAFLWNDDHFYLNSEELNGCGVFSVTYLGAQQNCTNYEVDLAVHAVDDENLEGKYVQRATGEPLPLGTEESKRRRNGLFVGDLILEKLALFRAGRWLIGLTLNMNKYE